jgi:chromosome partitioning protein
VAHIIVIGNEKGGAGKSTVSMHVATALARQGHRVGVLDLDLRQRTLARYLSNRTEFLAKSGLDLPTPVYHDLPEIDENGLNPGENAFDHRLSMAVASLEKDCDFILIDCPGSHTRLSQVAHSLADTLITPLNDSFVDFDLLAHVDSEGEEITSPSIYSEMVSTLPPPGRAETDRLGGRAQPDGRAGDGQQGKDAARDQQAGPPHRVSHGSRFQRTGDFP